MTSDEEIHGKALQKALQKARTNAASKNPLADLRFSKFIRFSGAPDTPTFPLSGLPEPTLRSLREETKADAIVIPDVLPDGKGDLEKIAKSEKPCYPGEAGFWNEFKTVLDFRIAREFKADVSTGVEKEEIQKIVSLAKNKWAWPNEWDGLSLEQIAEEVNGEYPASIQAEVIKKVVGSDVAKMEKNFILDLGQYEGNRSRSYRDFIGLQVLMADINTWTFRAVARENFMLKWHYGMPRPEEIAYLIACKNITTDDGVPKEIVDSVVAMEMDNPLLDFTPKEYNNGCPTHPSFPAMHSAGSTLSTWLPALFDISPEQYRAALLLDHGVAMARTVAGVHYVQDNLAGLNIGQRIIRERLPEYMRDNFGYDPEKVEKRLDDLKFDWKNFNSKVCKNDVGNCKIVGKFVGLYYPDESKKRTA